MEFKTAAEPSTSELFKSSRESVYALLQYVTMRTQNSHLKIYILRTFVST